MLNSLTAINTGVAAGGAGVATNNATGTERVTGKLLGFLVTYLDSPPAGTTDLTIQAVGGPLGTRTLLTLSNAATDGWFPVRQQVVSTAGADITGAADHIPLYQDQIKVTIAQANNGDSATVITVLEI